MAHRLKKNIDQDDLFDEADAPDTLRRGGTING